MRTRHKIILASIGLGLLMWLIDGLLDYLIFYPGSLLGLLIFDVPQHEIYIRLFTLISFVVFGLIVGATVERRERAEGRAKRASRALRMLSDCNQVLIRAEEESQLLEDVCRVIVDVGGYRLAWVGLASDDDPEDLQVVAKAGEDGDRVARLEAVQAGDDPGSSAALRAIRRGAPVTVGGLPAAPPSAPGSRGSGQDGHGAVMALPLKGREGTLGALSVYAREQERFGTEETRLLTELASDLAFGIQTLHDRGERRRIQRALRKSKSLLDRTGRIARVGGWELDAQTLEVSWTEQTYRIHEVPFDYEPPLDEAIDFFHPDDQDRLSRAIERALEEGEPYDLELRFITAKGNHLWTRAICEPQVVDGETVKLVGVFQDITARKQAEEALRASERRYRFLLRAIPVGVVVHDADTRILTANAQAEELLGLTQDQLIGRSAMDPAWGLLHADGTPMEVEAYPANRVVDRRVTVRDLTVGIRRPDREEPVWVSVNADPVLDNEGELERVLVTFMDITGRHKAREALAESRRMLNQTGKMGRIGGWEHDLETGQATWTDALYDIIEIPYDQEPPGTEEHLGYYPPEHRHRLEQAYNRAVEEGTPFDLELQVRTAKGALIWSRVHGERVLEDGDSVGMRGTFQDITQRKRAQVALRKERDRAQRYLDVAGVIIVALDAEGEITLVNRRGCEILGYDEEELVGRNWFDTCLPEPGRAEVKRVFRRLIAGEAEPVERYENPVVTSEGEERLIAWHNALLTDDDGAVVGTLSSGNDITARKRAEEELEQYTEQLETLREMDQAILAAHSPEEIASAALHRLRRLVPCLGAGVALYDFEGQEVELLAVDADADVPIERGTVLSLVGLEEAIEQSRRGEVFVERNLEGLDEPPPAMRALEAAGLGSFIGVPLLAHDYLRGVLGLALASPGGFSEGQIGVASDIADQLAIAIEHARLYEELQRQSAELEQRVAERTAELRDRMAEVEELNQALAETLADLEETNRQLDEKADELQAANAELEAFAYSVSHDLRAPLRAINGFAQIIARRHRDSLDEEGRRYFDNVVEASEHMGELIDDLLRFSRLGRQAVRLRPVALDDVFSRVKSDLAGRIAEEQAELILPDDLPTVEGSPTLLRQIFTNLVDNALTYHPPDDPPRIEVDWEAKEDSVVVSVADEGIGIAPEFHDKIFRIFQRLHSQDEFRGTGIGLAMVRKATDLLGGRIWVESAEGEGSTFYVKLPKHGSLDR